jgi:glycosyltransferase involved in cell wall biosynthesis
MVAAGHAGAPVMISIVIPVLNGEPGLADQLSALTRQSESDDWEILVADNGSTDRSVDIAHSFEHLLPLRVLDASAHRGRAAARNYAVTKARGNPLVFVDADDVADDQWLENLLAHRSRRVVTGRYRRVPPAWSPGDPVESRAVRPSFAGQPTLASGNLLIDRELFEAVGGFDKSYRCRVDVELAFRLRRTGVAIDYADDAIVLYRERASASGEFRQQYCWGQSAARLFREYRRDIPFRHSSMNSIKHWAINLVLAPWRLAQQRTRRQWCGTIGALLGQLIGSIRNRVLFL